MIIWILKSMVSDSLVHGLLVGGKQIKWSKSVFYLCVSGPSTKRGLGLFPLVSSL